jgi:hypothetical protein
MKVLVESDKIINIGEISPFNENQKIIDADYPVDENGFYLQKKLCRHINGRIVKISQEKLLSIEKEKKFKEFTEYTFQNIFKATKGITESIEKIQLEYGKTYNSEKELYSAISQLEKFIFS